LIVLSLYLSLLLKNSGEVMRKENCVRLLFAGVSVLFFMAHSVASAADTVVVIPLFTKTTTCTAPDEVRSAGYCWKNRNLGARLVAEDSNYLPAYGDYYQWGRPRDGHQNFNSITTTAISENDVPGHGDFIIPNPLSPNDWRDPRNDNLWQGLGGVNNPCPQGFRLPTKTELEAEISSWGVNNNAVGAFGSPLHLVVAGSRKYNDGTNNTLGSEGDYWSSTTYHTSTSFYMYFSDNAGTSVDRRAEGKSVRCIKD
jgi:uncharacterized protein (TIGR02145 family)